jgi:hypothetical protein
MEQWWNDTDRGKRKCLEKNLTQCHFVHNKSRTDWPRVEPGLLRREADDLPRWQGPEGFSEFIPLGGGGGEEYFSVSHIRF